MDATYYSWCHHIKPRGAMVHPRDIPATSQPLWSSCPTAPLGPATTGWSGNLHAFCLHTSQCHQIWASVVVQPKDFLPFESIAKGLSQKVPQYQWGTCTKYLNPSPATAKGHMKRPKKGIRSTQPKQWAKTSKPPALVPQIAPQVLPIFDEPPPFNGPAYNAWKMHMWYPTTSQLPMFFFVLEPLQIKQWSGVQWSHRKLSIHVDWWQCLLFCNVPLQNQCNHGKVYC